MSLTQNVTNFLQGTLKHTIASHMELPPHEQQQIALRADLCKTCLDAGKCIICNCKTPEMFYAPKKVDADGKFAQFLNKEQWETLTNNIDEYSMFLKGIALHPYTILHPRFDEFFDHDEFDSPDSKGSGKLKMQNDFLGKLVETRIIANIPFRITSGYRTPKHNKKVGGEANSAHTKGYAADIVARTNVERFIIVSAALKVGFNRIGIGNSYVHLDNDPSLPKNVMWDYYD